MERTARGFGNGLENWNKGHRKTKVEIPSGHGTPKELSDDSWTQKSVPRPADSQGFL